MMNRSARESAMNRPNCDLPTIAATVAVVPGLVLILLYANRFGLIHLVPVIAAILPFWATSWKGAALLRALAAGLFGAFALLGAMTIGVAFVPSAALSLWGMVRAIGRHGEERWGAATLPSRVGRDHW
ncbi:MAG: hypothetical protein OXU69_10220 [Gemmatimonadota bacterium]|nr:hypothetical protein [Gemmatimonadota bacterium]